MGREEEGDVYEERERERKEEGKKRDSDIDYDRRRVMGGHASDAYMDTM
jgi:hypothetical protein